MAHNHAAELLAVLTRFPRDEVVHAIPALAFDMAYAAPDADVPPVVADVVRAWMNERKLAATADAASVMAALEATYAKKPIAAELKAALNELLRSIASEGGGRAMKSFLGAGEDRVPVGAKAAPAGSQKNTPLARFALQVPDKNSEKK